MQDKSRGLVRREFLRRGAAGAGVAAVGLGAFSGNALAGCTVPHECPRTPGFWKNHLDMWHTDGHVHLGTGGHVNGSWGPHTYTDEEAMEILWTKPKGDKSIILAHQLIAAILNYKAGTDRSCLDPYVRAAREWVDEYGIGENVRHWHGGEDVKDWLDNYNNGDASCGCIDD